MSTQRQFSEPASRRIASAVRVVEASEAERRSRARIVAGDTSLPRGQYQYQVLQMVSQNTVGWDFVRAHPTL